MPAKLDAHDALNRYFLETRCKIIELAANLDRIDRGAGADKTRSDPRISQLRRAIQALLETGADRAERCQQVFSIPYDETWRPPNK